MKRIPPTVGTPAPDDDLRAPARATRVRGTSSWRRWLLALVATPVLLAHALVVALRWLPPPTTAFMLQSPTQPVHYAWVSRERIAEVARRAVIASEDQKFFDHDGFDVESIRKALARNEGKRRPRGASTISQQVAKNLFLWPGRSWLRKGLEAYATLLIEWTWGKDRILEVYLNVAEFGPGLYGVEAASQRYFGKPAARLLPEEAARLAAVLPSPRKWRAADPGPYVRSRTQWILGQMGYRPAPELVESEPEADDPESPGAEQPDPDRLEPEAPDPEWFEPEAPDAETPEEDFWDDEAMEPAEPEAAGER